MKAVCEVVHWWSEVMTEEGADEDDALEMIVTRGSTDEEVLCWLTLPQMSLFVRRWVLTAAAAAAAAAWRPIGEEMTEDGDEGTVELGLLLLFKWSVLVLDEVLLKWESTKKRKTENMCYAWI